jgi:predicted phage-related endonuclease
MSVQINESTVDLDRAAIAFLDAYIEAKTKIKEWTERADLAAEQVKAAMGECEIGLVNGAERIRWTSYETKRIDVKRLREIATDDQIAALEMTTTSRRFVVID